jgi:hypothetical protein
VSEDGKDGRDGRDGKDNGSPRRLVAAALAAWGLFAVFWAIFCVKRLAGRSLDDFFITYRYAWNLAHGNGFVFNPGERVYGVTDPGMVFWLAFWHRLTGVPVHWLGTVTAAAGLLATAGLMLWQGLRSDRRLPALLGGTLLMASTFLWAVHGAGVLMVLPLLLAAAIWEEERPGLTGGLAGIAVWFRPDAGVGLAALGLLLWRERRRFPVRFAVVAGLVLAAGLLASWLYFGTVVPNTLGAKRSFAAWDPAARASGTAFWAGAVPLLRRHLGSAWPAMAILGAAGQWPLWRRGGLPGRLLVLFGGSLALLYPLLGVPFFAWYVVPTVVALLYGVAYAVDWLGGALAGTRRRLYPVLAAGLFLLFTAPIAVRGWRWGGGLAGAADLPHYEAYRAAGLWVRGQYGGQSGRLAEISALEVGTLAYWSERHVEDLLGLVTPEAVPFVERHDVAGAFYNHPTEVLVLKPSLEGLIGALPRKPWFRLRYEEAVRFPAGEGEAVVVYRHRRGRHAPPL